MSEREVERLVSLLHMQRVGHFQLNGWDAVRLTSSHVEVIALPSKGGDIVSLRWLTTDIETLLCTPWGVRSKGAIDPFAPDSRHQFMDAYAGGWQTVFPNGGDESVENGACWVMHGEVWLTPFSWTMYGDRVEMFARLARSPFRVTKSVTVEGCTVRVRQTVTNESDADVEAMWNHHPAFGPPFIGPRTRVEIEGATVVVDDQPQGSGADLQPGARAAWPEVPGTDGQPVDLRIVPSRCSGVSRLAYLQNMHETSMCLTNDELGLRVQMQWDGHQFPHAWYWLEAGGTTGYPWFGTMYVLAIEPASTPSGHGITRARAGGHPLVCFRAGESRTAEIAVTLNRA